jgi:hypothetical protein
MRIIVIRHRVCLRVRKDVVDGVTEPSYVWALGKSWEIVTKWLTSHRIAWTSHGWRPRRGEDLITAETPLTLVKGKLCRASQAPQSGAAAQPATSETP